MKLDPKDRKCFKNRFLSGSRSGLSFRNFDNTPVSVSALSLRLQDTQLISTAKRKGKKEEKNRAGEGLSATLSQMSLLKCFEDFPGSTYQTQTPSSQAPFISETVFIVCCSHFVTNRIRRARGRPHEVINRLIPETRTRRRVSPKAGVN